MRKVDEKLLKSYRCGPCEYCGRPGETQPHHLFGRGHGGGCRLDVSLNLIRLCWLCHTDFHDGKIPRVELFAIVAVRESIQPEIVWTAAGVEDAVRQMMRAPKAERAAKPQSKTTKVVDSLLSRAYGLVGQIDDESARRWLRDAEKIGVK